MFSGAYLGIYLLSRLSMRTLHAPHSQMSIIFNDARDGLFYCLYSLQKIEGANFTSFTSTYIAKMGKSEKKDKKVDKVIEKKVNHRNKLFLIGFT